jgi:hypothetical protein
MLRFAHGLSDAQTEAFMQKGQGWTDEERLHQFSCPDSETGEAMKISGPHPLIQCLHRIAPQPNPGGASNTVKWPIGHHSIDINENRHLNVALIGS